MKLVVFVCTGNICRSPMAEYLLRDRLGPGSGWKVMSAGVSAMDGMFASRSGSEVLLSLGIDMLPHRSKLLDSELVDRATVIVVMSASHRDQIQSQFPKATEKVFLLKSFDESSDGGDIEDPLGASVDVYRRICREIESALPGLLDFLKELDVKMTDGK